MFIIIIPLQYLLSTKKSIEHFQFSQTKFQYNPKSDTTNQLLPIHK